MLQAITRRLERVAEKFKLRRYSHAQSLRLPLAPRHCPLTLIATEGTSSMTRRLTEMGLYEGAQLELCSAGKGALVIKVNEAKLALDGELAAGIWVKAQF